MRKRECTNVYRLTSVQSRCVSLRTDQPLQSCPGLYQRSDRGQNRIPCVGVRVAAGLSGKTELAKEFRGRERAILRRFAAPYEWFKRHEIISCSSGSVENIGRSLAGCSAFGKRLKTRDLISQSRLYFKRSIPQTAQQKPLEIWIVLPHNEPHFFTGFLPDSWAGWLCFRYI